MADRQSLLHQCFSLIPTLCCSPLHHRLNQIEHVARISKITPTSTSSGFYFRIDDAAPILEDCHVGDSICVNGACLTVTEFESNWFEVNLANETLTRTNLGMSPSVCKPRPTDCQDRSKREITSTASGPWRATRDSAGTWFR